MRKLFTGEEIISRVKTLASEIDGCYAGEPFICLVVLKGSFIFAADLVRNIENEHMTVDFVQLKSYEGTSSSGTVEMVMGELEKYRGKNILIVEDIVDTGLTLSHFLELLAQVKPASVKVCTFLEKHEIHQGKIPLDFVGYQIPAEFVVGYGLDFNQKYRHLPYVGIYDED